MHSSRMRTGRSLTVCWHLLPRGWSAWSGGVCLVGGCLPGQGAAWSREVSGPGGVPGPGGLWSCGGGAWSGGVSQHALRQTPLPPVDRHTLVKTLPWPNFVAAGKNDQCLFLVCSMLLPYLFSPKINADVTHAEC